MKVLSFFIFLLFFLFTLSATSFSAQVTLAWDPNSDPDLAGYLLYYGNSSGNYSSSISLGNVTTYTVANLSDGVAYYFALTARNTAGLESGYSNEVSYNPSNPIGSQFTLTLYTAGSGGGTVAGLPTGTTFNGGTLVSLTAAADPNSTFTGWSGACSGTTNPCKVTMNADTEVTASFTIITINQNNSYTLSISKNGSGKGAVANKPLGSSFKAGTAVTLTSTPDPSSVFGGWSGACRGTSNTCTVTMSAKRSVTATFNLRTYSVKATAGLNGSITPSGTTMVPYGGSQAYKINPASGFQVAEVRVDGNPVGALTSYTFKSITAAHTIEATFAEKTGIQTMYKLYLPSIIQ